MIIFCLSLIGLSIRVSGQNGFIKNISLKKRQFPYKALDTFQIADSLKKPAYALDTSYLPSLFQRYWTDTINKIFTPLPKNISRMYLIDHRIIKAQSHYCSKSRATFHSFNFITMLFTKDSLERIYWLSYFRECPEIPLERKGVLANYGILAEHRISDTLIKEVHSHFVSEKVIRRKTRFCFKGTAKKDTQVQYLHMYLDSDPGPAYWYLGGKKYENGELIRKNIPDSLTPKTD